MFSKTDKSFLKLLAKYKNQFKRKTNASIKRPMLQLNS